MEASIARLARAVFPGIPHHVTQRGNGRQQTFFCNEDYAFYRDLLRGHCGDAGVAIWSYVLMPNHVHLVLVPRDQDGLRRALAPVHRRYAGHVHARERRTGHFWQGRFGCVAMDEDHLGAAVRYVAMNPVRAGLCARAADWPWSSAATLLGLDDDGMTQVDPVRNRVPDIAGLLESAEDEERTARLRKGESVGRPIAASNGLTSWRRPAAAISRPENEEGRQQKVHCHRNYDGTICKESGGIVTCGKPPKKT